MSERGDRTALRRAGEQPQGLVDVGLAAAVRTGDEVERSQPDDEVPQRASMLDGEGLEHGLRGDALNVTIPDHDADPGALSSLGHPVESAP